MKVTIYYSILIANFLSSFTSIDATKLMVAEVIENDFGDQAQKQLMNSVQLFSFENCFFVLVRLQDSV
jgi:hypothetical protein